jgi:hypothetical protein
MDLCSITFFFFLIHVGCPGQLTRTTTIPHGPLDILQAQEQVRHRGGDRRAQRGSNPGGGAEQVHDGPQQLNPHVLGTHEGSNQGTQAGQSLPRPLSYKPRVLCSITLIMCVRVCYKHFRMRRMIVTLWWSPFFVILPLKASV